MSSSVGPFTPASARVPLARLIGLVCLFAVLLVLGAGAFYLLGRSPPPPPAPKSTYSPGPSHVFATAQPEQEVPSSLPKPAPQGILRPDSPLPMIFYGAAAPAPPAATLARAGAKANGGDSDDDTDVLEASTYRHPEWILPKNTEIPCLVPQPLETTLGGNVTCVVDAPQGGIRSADGSNVLIENGATINGHIERGVARGQQRMAVIWDDGRSGKVKFRFPNSAAVDGIGQTGVPAELDEHWGELLRGAVAFTAVDTAGTVLSNLSQREGTANVNLSQGQSVTAQAMQDAYGQVRPTLGVPTVGNLIQVQIAKDVSFRKAYRDAMRAGAN